MRGRAGRVVHRRTTETVRGVLTGLRRLRIDRPPPSGRRRIRSKTAARGDASLRLQVVQQPYRRLDEYLARTFGAARADDLVGSLGVGTFRRDVAEIAVC